MDYYKVSAGFSGTCACEACAEWTVRYVDTDGEVVEIGTSWLGEEGRDKAEDVCDLMNMAYSRGCSNGFKGA